MPPMKSSFWEETEKLDDTVSSRAWRGVITVTPTLGVLAAYATVEVMSEKRKAFGWATAKVGCARGFLYWLPFGSAAALYYGGELACRPQAAVLSRWLTDRIPTSLHGFVQVQPGELDDELPSSRLSKALAGGATGFGISVPMYLLGWRGFRGIGSIPVLTVLSTVAAIAMPEFEKIQRR